VARLDIRTFIRAQPEAVWRVISDLSGQSRWMVDVRRLEIVSEVKSGVGTVMDVTSELFGLPVLHDLMEIVRWEEPREIGVVHRGQFTGTAEFRLEAVPGGTVFVWIEDFNPPAGVLGEIGFRLVVESHLRKVWGRSMENVRLQVEGSAQA
jgi:uncharacterized protein YndB with AHSA1/START domain